MIPDEAVEAAAKYLHDMDCRSALHSGFPSDIECYDWMEEAKAMLEAAAPHMLAPILTLMDDPEHYDSRGPSNGYVSVDNLRAALDGAAPRKLREIVADEVAAIADLIEPNSGIGLANGATRHEVAQWIRNRATGYRNPDAR